jgi:hypothetical protein
MYITHSYLGTTQGRFRCLFLLLLEDYIEAQSHMLRDLDMALERKHEELRCEVGSSVGACRRLRAMTPLR